MTFPGGYRVLGETLEDAARRELFEETGMIINDFTLYKTCTKDEQRLIWIVFKTKIESFSFSENNETSEILTINRQTKIDINAFRGKLTEQLYKDLILENER